MPYSPRTLKERFWEGVLVIDDETSCWLWTRKTQYIRAEGGRKSRKFSVQQVSYLLHVGLPPPGMSIVRVCRTTRCVRPAHLRPQALSLQGSQHHSAKLTEELVLCLMEDLRSGMRTTRAASKYGVCPGVISNIKYKRAWKHLDYEPMPVLPKKYIQRERKLTESKVRELREKAAQGHLLVSLAEEYGIPMSGVTKILRRQIYKDVA